VTLPLYRFAVLAIAGTLITSCGRPSAPALPVAPNSSAVRNTSSSASPIQHVVIVIQENRSFVNIFAGFPGADAPMSGTMSNGKTIALHPIGLKTLDLCHEWANGIQDWDNGKMDAFDLNCIDGGQPGGKLGYSYVERSVVAPYWTMAQQYTLADRMFPTMFGPSFTAHLDLIAGTSDLQPTSAVVDSPSSLPWGCDSPVGTTNPLLNTKRQVLPGGFPCYKSFRTLADTLDAANVSWRYYSPTVNYGNGGGYWSAFDAIKNVRYGPDWNNNVISPSPQFLTDVAKGQLAGVTWIVPDWPYSDHAGGGDEGPSWVAAVVNAVGRSKFWNSTAIVVLWDDWGGFYDDAPPPQLDFRGLGLRVGCIIVSPYAKPHYVSHTQYEFGSILKFIENVWGLQSLGTTDVRANSIIDCFDFTQAPRSFNVIPAKYGKNYFLQQKPSYLPVDTE